MGPLQQVLRQVLEDRCVQLVSNLLSVTFGCDKIRIPKHSQMPEHGDRSPDQAAKYAALADHFGALFVLAGFAVENYTKARLLANRGLSSPAARRTRRSPRPPVVTNASITVAATSTRDVEYVRPRLFAMPAAYNARQGSHRRISRCAPHPAQRGRCELAATGGSDGRNITCDENPISCRS
jgi:hypothetical protein